MGRSDAPHAFGKETKVLLGKFNALGCDISAKTAYIIYIIIVRTNNNE